MANKKDKMDGLMQVFLPNMQVKEEKPDNQWFMYQANGKSLQLAMIQLLTLRAIGWEALKPSNEEPSPPRQASTSPAPVQSASPASSEASGGETEDDANSPMAELHSPPVPENHPIIKRDKPWRKPNASFEPVYDNCAKNIFMKLQRREITDYSQEPIRQIQFLMDLAPPDDLEVLPIDSKYFTYFISEVPKVLRADRFFRTAATSIFNQSINEPVLRHSILAVSSWIVDDVSGRSTVYPHQHLQRVLPRIRTAIYQSTITRADIISVSFLAWLAFMSDDFHLTQRHLKGLFLMFLEHGHLDLNGDPKDNPDPLLMCLYRLAIKLDNNLAYMNFPLAFPPLGDHTALHRQWLPHFIGNQEDMEDCLASFKLDDFTNQIAHLHRRPEPEIVRRGSVIATELAEWLTLPAVVRHESTASLDPSSDSQNLFLNHPPYPVDDRQWAEDLLIHAALQIHLSIEMTGELGPCPLGRCEAAVQVCRIHGAIGTKICDVGTTGHGKTLSSLFLAGLVFDPQSYATGSLAFQWVVNELFEADRDKGYRHASRLADALREIWAVNGKVDPFEVVGRKFGAPWKVSRDEVEQ